jgi:hypothetical protein
MEPGGGSHGRGLLRAAKSSGGTSKDATHAAESSRRGLQVEQQQRNSGAGADFSGRSGMRAFSEGSGLFILPVSVNERYCSAIAACGAGAAMGGFRVVLNKI